MTHPGLPRRLGHDDHEVEQRRNEAMKKAKGIPGDDDGMVATARRLTPIDDDVEGHRLATNDDETIVEDDGDDVEGHLRRAIPGDESEPSALKRAIPDDGDDVEGHGRRR